MPEADFPVFSIGVWGKAALRLRGDVKGFTRVSGPQQFLARPGGLIQLEISDRDSVILDAAMSRRYGQKVGTNV